MKQKILAMLLALMLAASLAACGGGEETTLSGMVVSVEGTVISLTEMDGSGFAEGQRPEMPEGMELPEGMTVPENGGMPDFGSFDPETFDGTLPEGETFPQRGEGEGPERPEGMEAPEGMTPPEDGEMPDFGGEGGMGPGFGSFGENMETKDVDIADAHISLEIEGGKASGSLEDITPGTFVTVTLNGKGEATYVLVSSGFAFGG